MRLDLFRRLIKIGLVGLRRRMRARASIFFVWKKDRTVRTVIDGREPSSLHRRPPHTSLGLAGALSSLDLSGLAEPQEEPSRDAHGASANLRQGFYQLLWPEMASWFAFDFPEAAAEFGTNWVFDEDSRTWQQVAWDTPVFACFQGLPMGWSWSLHLCNLLTKNCLLSRPVAPRGHGQHRARARVCGPTRRR